VWIADEKGVTDAIWLLMNRKNEFDFKGEKYKISLKKTRIMYSTGLDAKKDPGVWIVWLGCTALIFGFVIVFWVPHRKVWLWLGKHEGKAMVVLSGQSNKNKIQFDRDFEKIERAIEKALGEKK
jgi:cytochrome c biogenesis protein